LAVLEEEEEVTASLPS